MTCPGGCIGGGGQPRFTDNQRPPGPHRRHLPRGRGQEAPQVAREPRRRSSSTQEFLGQPLGEKSHHLLHTKYTPRERV